jgi:hypothetical protein
MASTCGAVQRFGFFSRTGLPLPLSSGKTVDKHLNKGDVSLDGRQGELWIFDVPFVEPFSPRKRYNDELDDMDGFLS